jgi:hypothetical protein
VAVSEQRRRLLHGQVAEALGVEVADMLLDQLPPLDWSDLATKADLGLLRGEMSELRGEMVALRGSLELRMASQTRTIVFATVAIWLATMGTVGGMFAALAH